MAGMLDVTCCALSSWLEGRARPKLEELVKIAEHFDITLDVLVRTDIKKWYVVRDGFNLERIVEQGPKLVIEK
jgi:transcriptional regulator with XRE-family HTH domain